MSVLGVDPGATGAIAFEGKNGGLKVFRFKDKTPREIAFAFEFANFGSRSIAYVENVGAMPKDGKHNAFQFGFNTGFIHGILETLDFDIKLVHSQAWQRFHKLGAKFASKTDRKNAHKALAQKLFPDIKVTLDMADAILIAVYGFNMEST